VREYLKRLASTGAAYTASSVISKLFAVALLPLYTEYLTRADYGAAEVLLASVVALSIFFRFGIVEALLRFYYVQNDDSDSGIVGDRRDADSGIVGDRRDADSGIVDDRRDADSGIVDDRRDADPFHRDAVVRSAVGFLVLAITAGALLTAAFAGPLSEALLDRRETELMLISACGLWVFTLYELMMALFRLDERARAYFTASFANVLLTIALTVWLVVGEDEGARGLLLGNFGGSALILTGLFWVHRRRVALLPSVATVRPMLIFGLPTMPAELSLYALNVIDRVALARLAGLAEAGLYSLAVKFSQVVTVVVRAFNLAWPPLAYSIREDEDARRTYSLVVTYYLLVSFTIVLALSLEARWVARLLAAPEFFESYKAVPLVATGVTLYALYLVLSVAVGRAGRTGYNFPVTAVALACNIALNLLLIPAHGIVGAGIALVASYLVMVALMYLVTRRVFPLGIEWLRILRIVGFAGGLFAFGELVLPDTGTAGLLSRAALVPAFWALLFATGFFHAAELAQLRETRTRVRAALKGSGEPPQDLEALRSRTELMDEVHDPQ
jgi:O-antigen/teichoic acid export membrane protein